MQGREDMQQQQSKKWTQNTSSDVSSVAVPKIATDIYH